jgi:hypothetical protein
MSNDVDTIITNMQNYADSSISGMDSFLSTIDSLVSSINISEITNTQNFNYVEFAADAGSILSDILNMEPAPYDMPQYNLIDIAQPSTDAYISSVQAYLDKVYASLGSFPSFFNNQPQLNFPEKPPAFSGNPPIFVGDVAGADMPERPNLTLPNEPIIDPIIFPDPPDINFEEPPDKILPVLPNPPSINRPVRPNLTQPQLPAELGGDPAINVPTFPTAPVISFANAPALIDIQFPAPPTLQMPNFTIDIPVFNGAMPDTELEFELEAFDTNLVELEDFTEYLENMPKLEEIWQKIKDAEIQSSQLAIEEIKKQYTAYGFPIPPGEMFRSIKSALFKSGQSISSLSRDIAIKTADIVIENRKFSLDKALQYKQLLHDIHKTRMELMLRSQIAVIELGLSMFKTQVDLYVGSLAAYKTKADIFTTQIQFEISKLEIFRSEIAASTAQLDANKAQVSLYSASLDAEKVKAEVYSVEVEAAKSGLQLELGKLEIFRQQVELYKAKLDGVKLKASVDMVSVEIYKAEVEMADLEIKLYQAESEAEKTKIQAYMSQVEAYKSSLEAEKAKVEVYATEVNAAKTQSDANIQQVNLFNAQVESIKSLVDLYRVEVSAMATKTEADKMRVEVFKSQIEAYAAQIKAKESEYEAYKAAVGGESVKAEVFASQVKAYAAEAQTKTDQAEIASMQLKAATETSRIMLDTYKANLESSLAQNDNMIKLTDIGVKQAGTLTNVFATKLEALTRSFGILQQAMANQLESDRGTERYMLEKANMELSKQLKVPEFKMQGGGYKAEMYKAKIAGALGTINAIASKTQTEEL